LSGKDLGAVLFMLLGIVIASVSMKTGHSTFSVIIVSYFALMSGIMYLTDWNIIFASFSLVIVFGIAYYLWWRNA
jgi:hypothetical protein